MSDSERRVMQGVDAAAKKIFKGPADRVQELQAARTQTLAEIASGEAKKQGYDGKARLQGIDREINRLTPPKGGWPQPKGKD